MSAGAFILHKHRAKAALIVKPDHTGWEAWKEGLVQGGELPPSLKILALPLGWLVLLGQRTGQGMDSKIEGKMLLQTGPLSGFWGQEVTTES